MNKSIQKALAILQHLSKQPDNPLMLNDIAQAVGITVPTCARILDTLIKTGYTEKYGKRRGFILGPMAFVLSANGPYMRKETLLARPEVEKCARRLEEFVRLAALRGLRCYSLVEANGNPEIQVQTPGYHEDFSGKATGRLLLAFAGKNRIDEYIKTRDLQTENWPGCKSKKGILAELEKIRKERFVLITSSRLAMFAYPVDSGKQGTLALGCCVPTGNFTGKNKEKILACVKNSAAAIEQKLTERNEHEP